MPRTKSQIRSAKSKGASFEYDCWDSLKPIYTNIVITRQLGYQMQCDLINEESRTVFECKRLKSMSWNETKKYLRKLQKLYPEYCCLILFKSNQQPCLVMYWEAPYKAITVKEFESFFGTPFIKHKSTRRQKR